MLFLQKSIMMDSYLKKCSKTSENFMLKRQHQQRLFFVCLFKSIAMVTHDKAWQDA